MIRTLFPLFINATPSVRPSTAQEVGSAAPSFGSHMVLEMVGALLLVLLVIVALAWLLRGVQRMGGGWRSDMRVVGQVALGARERAVVVEVGQEQFLLGVGPGQVRFLCRLDQPISEPERDPPSATRFGQLLQSFQRDRGPQP